MSVYYDDAALAAARAYCGWVVTPSETETIIVDGSAGRVLSLPTLHLLDVSVIVEDDLPLTAAEVRWSTNQGAVYKRSGRCWTSTPAGIEATITHGFDEAPDFDAAVEQITRAMSSAAGRDQTMTGKRVDDVEYQWSVSLIQSGAVSDATRALLAPYRILPAP